MLRQKTYSCAICKTKPDQISHHKSHLETQKHKDKKELFELKISKLSNSELEEQYNNTIIIEIVNTMETIIFDNDIKLNGNNNNNIHHNNDNMIYNQVQYSLIMEESNSISNRDALKDRIHEIHNFLRNNGAGYGMNALKVFNILYGLKKIEENNLLDKVNLQRPICEFSHLLKLANENKDEDLAELIFVGILTSISQSNIRDLLFYEIPQTIKGSVFVYLVKEINKITMIEKTCNVLLSGKIYEYFIGRDESAISELGAYFTDRHIVDHIYQKLKPTIYENGEIGSMIDMFGGSGGFTTGYINYINQHSPTQINWETEINKIYHYDMNEDVIKSAALEFFCLTGVLPNMKNLKYKNSFTDEFVDTDGRTHKKYKYVITNPPYGGDKNNKTEAQSKREKVKEYIKNELLTITDNGLRIRRQEQLKNIEAQEKQEKKESDKTKVSVSMCSGRLQKFAKDHGLKGNDKESCSFMLLMAILEVEGTAIGVLKEGVFFNRTYKDLRKCVVENFNVREIISVPQDQFENTSTKTSIIIFDNTEEKTTEVKFSDLVVERYTEDKFAEAYGEVVIIENKGDIVRVSDKLVSVACREEILGNSVCSLNGKDYNKKEIIVGEDYKLIKLGDICGFLPKSQRNASYGKQTGSYNFYTSSEKVKKCDIADYTEECLIIGSGGVANIQIDTTFSCSADNFILKSQFNNFIINIFKGNMTLLSDGFKGSTLKHLSKEYLTNLKIPLPKSQDKIQEWVDKISLPYNEKNTKQTQIKELENFVQTRIREIGENEECDEVELGSVCEYIKTGKNKTPDNKQGTLYPYYGTADITGYTNHYLFDGKHILIARNGTMGNCFLVEGKVYPSDHIFVIKNNKIIPILTLYYLIKSISTKIQNSSNGSIIKGISKENLSKIKIKIPKNKQIIQDLETTFQQIEILQNQVKVAEKLYKQYIQELSDEAIPKQQSLNTIEQPKDLVPSSPVRLSEETWSPQGVVFPSQILQKQVVVIPKKKTIKEAIPNKNTGQTGELKNEFIIQPEFIIEEPKVEDKIYYFKKKS